MPRVTDAILKTAYAKDHSRPMLDLSFGGQFGWAANLDEWVSNQAYVRKPLIPILLEVPKFFSIMPDPAKWTSSLKALIELHAKSIDGLAAGLEVSTDEHAVGGGGEMQKEFTDVKRARSSVKISVTEKYGNPIQAFLEAYIMYGMMHQETKYAMIATVNGTPPTDMLADWYTFTCAFIEPDPTHKRVVRSWITTNLFPEGTGDIVGKRDITGGGELLELDIEFGGISQYNAGTDAFAQKLLDGINITGANPHLKAAFIKEMSADVAASKSGYIAGIDALRAGAVPGIGK